MRRTKNQDDFFLGGRTMGRFTVALSAVSFGRSSWLVLGLSGMAWKMGLGAVWAIVGYIVVEALQFVSICRRLGRVTQQQGSITLLDYFEARFDDRSHVLRLVGAGIIGVFITAYVAAQFNAGAKTLSTALELPLWVSLLASGALILVYMVPGGFVAVAYNDVIRALIMLVGLVVLPVVAFVHLGGWGDLSSILGRTVSDPAGRVRQGHQRVRVRRPLQPGLPHRGQPAAPPGGRAGALRRSPWHGARGRLAG